MIYKWNYELPSPEVKETEAAYRSFLQESLANILIVKSFCAEDYSVDKLKFRARRKDVKLTEEDKETVRDMVRLMRQRRAGKQRE